jgi:hypothetical protein
MGFMDFLSFLNVKVVVDVPRVGKIHPSQAEERWREVSFGHPHQGVPARHS